MARQGSRIGVKRVSEALRQARGLVTVAARILDCRPQTVYDYLDRYSEVRQAREEADTAMTDLAEGALFKAISDRESWAVQFYLRTKGKNRGYGDKVGVEVSGPSGGPIRVDVGTFLEALAIAEAGATSASGAGGDPASDVQDAG